MCVGPMCVHTCVDVCTYIYMYAYYIYVYIYYKYIHTYIYMYTYTYICTYNYYNNIQCPLGALFQMKPIFKGQ